MAWNLAAIIVQSICRLIAAGFCSVYIKLRRKRDDQRIADAPKTKQELIDAINRGEL